MEATTAAETCWTKSSHRVQKTPASKTTHSHPTRSRKRSSRPPPPSSHAPPRFSKKKRSIVWRIRGEKTRDDLVGVSKGVDPLPGACVAEKGGVVGKAMRDEVAAGLTEAEEREDRRGSDGGRGGLCIDRTV
ncbi:hypothetical protein RHGRI_021833 [Rhododendron griersonianum]|uniref:Uncharacterized protein n=1 Tax=Rhododendron griersonianum TaxID=479676 RepID=A0AAV6JLK9_9ERIC|nr:hypothetical protein RHGRI_021833 [Rhododendron griersonianum]